MVTATLRGGRVIHFLFLASVLFQESHAGLDASLGTAGFAAEAGPSLSATARLQIEDSTWRVEAMGLLESGPSGQWSLEVPELYVKSGGADLAFAVGRARVLEFGQARASAPLSAFGAAWVQNQVRPLDPVTDGWLGLTGRFRDSSGLFVTVSASPIYLPTMGPSLTLEPDQPPRGSRYAVLPPTRYDVGGVLLPLHYRVNVGDIGGVILQPQAFASVGVQGEIVSSRVAFWTAPSTIPVVTATGGLQVSATAPTYVLVDAVPSFPRENIAALELELTGVPLKPRLQVLRLVDDPSRWSYSVDVESTAGIGLGYLHANRVESGPTVEARLADQLFWVKYLRPDGRIRPGARWLLHPSRRDMMAEVSLSYALGSWSALSGRVQVLTGEDGTYFGNWRSLDQVELRWEVVL